VNPIFAAALEIQSFCRSEDWRFCIIGAVAVQRWGEPRLTRDVDLTVLSGFGSEERWIERLLEKFRPRTPDALDFAVRTRVVLLNASNEVPLDVSRRDAVRRTNRRAGYESLLFTGRESADMRCRRPGDIEGIRQSNQGLVGR
jgi:hypothetical protein